MNINRVTLQHDRQSFMVRFYFSLFMVLWCVIFKSVWYLRASFWLLHAMFIPVFVYDWKQVAQRLKLRERLRTINKIKVQTVDIIRWNVHRDNNFHSRRQVLRVNCLWKSWVVYESGKHKLINFVNNLADLCFKPAFQCLLFFKMNSRQENRSDPVSFYSQNRN